MKKILGTKKIDELINKLDLLPVLKDQLRQVRWLYNNSNKCTMVYEEKLVVLIIHKLREKIFQLSQQGVDKNTYPKSFVLWYSGMEKEKVERAYQMYLREHTVNDIILPTDADIEAWANGCTNKYKISNAQQPPISLTDAEIKGYIVNSKITGAKAMRDGKIKSIELIDKK